MEKLSEGAIELNDIEVFHNCSYSCYMNIAVALNRLKEYEEAGLENPMDVIKSNYKYKAVDTETNEIHYYDASKCPKCDKWLTKIYKYCPHCGQRIIEI